MKESASQVSRGLQAYLEFKKCIRHHVIVGMTSSKDGLRESRLCPIYSSILQIHSQTLDDVFDNLAGLGLTAHVRAEQSAFS